MTNIPSCTGNSATNNFTRSKDFHISGNIIPLNWYKSITTVGGKPDLNAITILSEIFYWYRPKSLINPESAEKILVNKFPGELWQTSYRHFEEKFTYNHQRIRRALVRLEQLGLIERIITNIKLKGQKYTNVLFIKLNIAALNKIVTAKFQLHDSENKSQKNPAKPELSKDSAVSKNVAPSLQECRDHMNSNTTKQDSKSRSNESNFIESNSEERKVGKDLKTSSSINRKYNSIPQIQADNPILTSLMEKVKTKFIGNKRKPIAELSPLTEEEASSLRVSSGREFNLNYINKLIEKLGKQYPAHGFYSRTLFLKYISSVLANELRQETVVNNEAFRFRANDDETRKQNYITKVEESMDTCKQSRLRKKIAGSFDTETSYKLITSCTFRDKIQNNNNFEIIVSELINLSANQQATLLDLVRSVYGNKVQGVEFILNNNFKKEVSSETPVLNFGQEGTLWNKVSKKLLEYYGEGIHRSWFSRLEAEENEIQNKLILKAPTRFIGDWIKSNYLGKMYEHLQCLGDDLRNIEVMS